MKTESLYFYIMDYNNMKSEYLINDLYKKADPENQRKFVAIIGPTNLNIEETDLNIGDENFIILKIDEGAFINCKELKRIIVPNTILYVEKDSLPEQTKIIVEDKEYTVDEYKKYIEKSNVIKLILEIKLIFPCLKEINKIIKIIKKSKTTSEAEKMISIFLIKKTKMNENDSKKAASLILTLKLFFIASLDYEKLKRKIAALENEL